MEPTRGNSLEAAINKNQADTPATPIISLPEDARCHRCGYLLRGLTIARCPECGKSFEPDAYHRYYLPKWPVLLGFYLLSRVVVTAAQVTRDIWQVWTLPLSPWTLGVCAQIGFLPICTATALGLMRRKKWARMGVMVVALLVAIIPRWGVYGIASKSLPIAGTDARIDISDWFQLQSVLLNAVFPACLIAFPLFTRQHRQSMSDRSQGTRLPVFCNYAVARRDWMMFPIVVFLLEVASQADSAVYAVQTLVSQPKVSSATILQEVIRWVGLLKGCVMPALSLVGALVLWRQPRHLSKFAGAMIIIWFSTLPLSWVSCIITPGTPPLGNSLLPWM